MLELGSNLNNQQIHTWTRVGTIELVISRQHVKSLLTLGSCGCDCTFNFFFLVTFSAQAHKAHGSLHTADPDADHASGARRYLLLDARCTFQF